MAGLNLPDSYYTELQASHTAKRELFLGFLQYTELRFTEPEGAYYVLVDIAESGCPGLLRLASQRRGVAALPGSSLFREPVHNLIRFHFAKRRETLEAAGQRLIGLRERAARAPGRVCSIEISLLAAPIYSGTMLVMQTLLKAPTASVDVVPPDSWT